MAGVILEPITSPEAILRNLQRLNEAVVALQGGKIAMENIVGYEDLATKLLVETQVEKLKIPVGGRYYSTSNTNPADFFGYGTWELVGAGRVEIGVGEATDSREETKTFAVGEKGGEFEHQLSVDEMPKHKHSITTGEWAAEGGADADKLWSDSPGSPDAINNTDEAGNDKAHNNMQPYEVIYKWERKE